MPAPPGGSVVLDFTTLLSPPSGGTVTLQFTTGAPMVGVSAKDQSAFGYPALKQASVINPAGFISSQFKTWPFTAPVVGRAAQFVAPTGWLSQQLNSPQYVRWRRFYAPASLYDSTVPSGVSVRLLGGYQPAPGSNVNLNFSEPLSPPPGSSVVLEFGASGYTHILGATVGSAALFGSAIINVPAQISPASIGMLSALGTPTVGSTIRYVSISLGVAPPTAQVSSPTAANRARVLNPTAISASGYGTPKIWNFLQYASPGGHVSSAFGSAFLSGGVKAAFPAGIDSLRVGSISVVNTRANQVLVVTGIASPAFGAVIVRPELLYPRGFFSGSFGNPLVQRNPSPVGFISAKYGTPAIEYKTKHVTLTGIPADDPGYPRVRDRAQKVLASSVVQSAVFGDIRLVNKNKILKASGFATLEMSEWAIVQNTRRFVQVGGWSSLSFSVPEIKNKTPSIKPIGFSALHVPSSSNGIGYRVRSVNLSGFNRSAIGAPTLTQTPSFTPLGFDGSAFGAQNVWFRTRHIGVAGKDSQIFGALDIWFRYRKLFASGADMSVIGSADIDYTRRKISLQGDAQASYGQAHISNANRNIYPVGIYQNFATAHMVGGLRFLRPSGFIATAFGSRIIPVRQTAAPLGFAGSYGIAHIDSRRKVIAPNGFNAAGQQLTDRWGVPRLANKRQYITMFYDVDSELNPPVWPRWTLIENRTRPINVVGSLMSRISEPYVYNNARGIYPIAIEAPTKPDYYKAGMVAYRVRYERIPGIEPPYMSQWAVVYNSARVLGAKGFVASLFGAASVVKTRRYFDHIGGFVSAAYGTPMVAPRIRNITFEGRYTIGAPVIQLPQVKLHTRYIDGIGKDLSGIGSPSLVIHFTRITPRWTPTNFYGSPIVYNKTPQLRIRGRNSEEFGDTALRLQWRPVKPDGSSMQLFGKTDIAYRDRTRFITGFNAGAMGLQTVTKTGAPPYSTQYIWLDEVMENGPSFGIGIPKDQVSSPIINQQVVYVIEKDQQTLFGNPAILSNSIRVEPGMQILGMGEPTVDLRIRTLVVAKWTDVSSPSKARVSPHTIWAVMEAPEQAKTNQPPITSLHYVQSESVFGTPELTLRHRKSFVTGVTMSAYGFHSVDLRKRVIKPTAINSLRMGYLTVPGALTVEQYDSFDGMEIGLPIVKRPPYTGPQYINGVGFNSFNEGALRIELFNRSILMSGLLSEQMGTFLPQDKPYAWKGLRVGPLMPTIPDGIDMSLFGLTWVSNRIRGIAAQGFASFAAEYQLDAFDKRMKVARKEPPRSPRCLSPVGIYATTTGFPDVRLGARYIRPDGNSDQYRKGAF